MESLNNRTYIMPEADIKPFFPADSVVASDRILHTLTGLGNNKAVATFIAVICFLMTANLNAQTLDWVKTFGGIGYDIGNSVTVDDEGNIYTTGSFNDTVDFDPGPDVMKLNPGRGSAIFIQKLDANGNFIWAKSCGGKGNQIGQSIKVDAMGDVYTTGIFQDTIDFNPGTGVANLSAVGEEDVFILKLDANGNFLWAKSFGGIEMDRGYSIAIDAEGNVYTTGYFIDTVDFDPGTGVTNLSAVGGKDIFILKLDPNGNFVWAKSFGGTEGIGIAIDGMGNVITTGYFSDTVDFDPGTGVMNLTSAGETDIFILKLDANGNLLWAKSCGGYWIVGGGISITFDATNNVYTTGAFDGTVDFDPGTGVKNLSAMGESDIFIQKLDAQGNFIWAKTFGGNDFDQSYSIAIDAESNVYSIGDFVGTVDFDPGTGVANLSAVKDGDIFIQKLDAQGNFIWAKSFGGEGHNFGSSIDVDAANNIYTTGLFRNTVDFDPGTDVKNLKSIGGYDIYVHKMKQTATGVADIDNGIDISLYPNPSNGFIHIALNEAVGEASITITDLQGKIIHSEQMSAATKSSMDIQAPNGVYFIHELV